MPNFYSIPTSFIGPKALTQAMPTVGLLGARRALVVADRAAVTAGPYDQLDWLLRSQNIQVTLHELALADATVHAVDQGLALLKRDGCELVVSLGSDVAHDCAKGIALCATNGGQIGDYEGVNRSALAALPLVCINISGAGGSHAGRFCLIAHPSRAVPIAIVDRHVLPMITIGDSELMAGLTRANVAAIGMETLGYAVEAYVSTGATPMSEGGALKAVELVSGHLEAVVNQQSAPADHDALVYAQILAGAAHSHAFLGYANALARQLRRDHGLPRGVGTALILPHLQRFNAPYCARRLADVARAMGVCDQPEGWLRGAQLASDAMVGLALSVGMPEGLAQLGITEAHLPRLAAHALQDPCGISNPRNATQHDLEDVLRCAL